jgi:hypothetical protein
MNSVQLLIDRVRLTEKQKLDDLCQWLLGHLHESIGWSVLVQRSKMSNEELHRLFMQHHHMSPMQWIGHPKPDQYRDKASTWLSSKFLSPAKKVVWAKARYPPTWQLICASKATKWRC